MVVLNIDDMYKAHNYTTNNFWLLQQPQNCRCIYCLRTFHSTDIEDFMADDTAICPYCGIDAVIGEASGYTFTDEQASMMYEVFFNTFTEGISEHILVLELPKKHKRIN